MLLLIDAGNTRVKWALVAKPSAVESPSASTLGQWHAAGSVTHDGIPELTKALRAMQIERVLIANVAGAAVREALELLLANVLPPETPVEWFVSLAACGGLRNTYLNPAQLGCDRFAAAIGAHALLPGRDLIVATCGTATTIDAVSADGVFLGGMILPGLALMTAALARNTAQLPQVSLHANPHRPFADHTDAAIASGCLAAQAGAIERAVIAHRLHTQGEVTCILAGGAADLIAPQLSLPHQRIDNLVLIGLQIVATSSC
ncbi:type III pantothenate kinase [uncultured Oxalicibacterium sp.]|uniref:type III pantothenate kinase n=1 Tax=uncultured Oxalicibacterium sp. TaxID=1168540 RepID=UPI0025F20918|nr:type III pantothenate kinase [uncultured Oxalicibacterium sp.]